MFTNDMDKQAQAFDQRPSGMQIELKRLTVVKLSDIVDLMTHPLVRRQMPLARDTFTEEAAAALYPPLDPGSALIDWLIVEIMRPAFIVQSSVGQLMAERNYWFHFQGFLKGRVGSLIASLLLAGIILFFVTL